MAEKIYLGKTTLSGIETLPYCDLGHNSHHFGNRNCAPSSRAARKVRNKMASGKTWCHMLPGTCLGNRQLGDRRGPEIRRSLPSIVTSGI